jgi:glycerophosphoryl diester phosphodiesterase
MTGEPSRVDWLRGLTIAHRGYHAAHRTGPLWASGWVENSPSAIAGAVRAGLGVECDVQISADGQAIVFHDESLDRLTHVTGPLTAHPAAILQRIPIGGSRDTIPTLAQVLDIIAGQVPLLIEIKLAPKQNPAPLCEVVTKALENYPGPVAVMSFSPKAPKWFAVHAPHIPRGLVIDAKDMTGWRAKCMTRWTLPRSHAEFAAIDIRALPNSAAALWRETMPLATWTVRRDFQRDLALAHADALIAEGDGLP